MFPQSQEQIKLEWMYKGPNSHVEREEYLLGRSVDKTLEQLNAEEKQQQLGIQPPKNHVEHECIPPSIRDYKLQASDQVDLTAKLQEDPLIAIKKREEENRRQFLNNPIQIKKLQKALKMQQKGKKKKKKKHKHAESDSDEDLDAKLAKKLKMLKQSPGVPHYSQKVPKKSKKDDVLNTILMHKYNELKSKLSDDDLRDILQGKIDTSSDSSDSEEESRKKSKGKSKKNHASSSSSEDERRSQFQKQQTSKGRRSRSRSISNEDRFKKKNQKCNKSRRRSSSSDKRLKPRSVSNEGQKYRKERRNESRDRRRSRSFSNERQKYKKERRNESRDRRRSRSFSNEREQGRRRNDRLRSKSVSNERQRNRNYDRERNRHRGDIKTGHKYGRSTNEEKYKWRDSHQSNESKMYTRKASSSSEDQVRKTSKKEHRKTNESSDDSESYKLNRSSSSSSESEDSDGKNKHKMKKAWGLVRADGTKLPTLKKDNKEDVFSKRENLKTQENKIPDFRKRAKLTEEEKEKRRREMMENATWRDSERVKNVKQYRENELKELQDQTKYDPEFLQKQLLKSANSSSVESRIKANINNIQRSGSDMNKHFSKR